MDGNTLEVDLWLDGGLVTIYCPEELTNDDVKDLRELFKDLLSRVRRIKKKTGRPRDSQAFPKLQQYLQSIGNRPASPAEISKATGVPVEHVRILCYKRYADMVERVKEPGKPVAFRLRSTEAAQS